MKPLAERDPFQIGIVAIVVGGLVGLVIVVLSVVCFGTDSYTAVLEHTAGLRKGEDVQVHGVSVGKVTGVRLMDTDSRGHLRPRRRHRARLGDDRRR